MRHVVVILLLLAAGVLGLHGHQEAGASQQPPLAQRVAKDGPVGQPGHTWRMVVKEAARVDADVVTLGDIATPMGLVDQTLWQQYALTPLFQAPPEKGKPMYVQPEALRSAITKHLGKTGNMVIITKRLVLQRGGVLLDKDALKQEVVRKLTSFCSNLGGDLEFREVKGPEFLFMEDASHTLRIIPSQGVCEAGRQGFRIQEQRIDGRVLRSLAGSVFLDAWQEILVASRPLSKDEPLTPDMLATSRKNISYVKGTPWDGQGGPWRLARSVGQGQPITPGDLEPLPAIVKGAHIEMVFEGQHVTLRVPALALSDAAIGERILVKNTQSHRDVYATVRDTRTVFVQ